jgi:hypothetical protein
MMNDPVVGGIRHVRQKYAEKFNNDLHAILGDRRRGRSLVRVVFATKTRSE